jgi:NAD+--asparagine ADP-ribosyltransferase
LSLVLGLGLLIIPVLLLVLVIPTWEARTVDARDAAAGAARVLVTSASWTAGVVAANQLVGEIGATDGVARSQLVATYDGSLTRGSTVTVRVTVVIPATEIPLIGVVGTVHYTATSSELVDQYRSLG